MNIGKEWEMTDMDCLKHHCQFRVNETNNPHRCECIACPNRYITDRVIITDKTISEEELRKFLRED